MEELADGSRKGLLVVRVGEVAVGAERAVATWWRWNRELLKELCRSTACTTTTSTART